MHLAQKELDKQSTIEEEFSFSLRLPSQAESKNNFMLYFV